MKERGMDRLIVRASTEVDTAPTEPYSERRRIEGRTSDGSGFSVGRHEVITKQDVMEYLEKYEDGLVKAFEHYLKHGTIYGFLKAFSLELS